MRIPFVKQISWYLVAAMFIVGICPRVDAGLAPSAVVAQSMYDRAADIEKIQRILETKVVRDRLEKLGFTVDEINARFAGLSDEQMHQLALQIDDLRIGKDGAFGVIVALLVIAILVVILIMLAGHKVVITK